MKINMITNAKTITKIKNNKIHRDKNNGTNQSIKIVINKLYEEKP